MRTANTIGLISIFSLSALMACSSNVETITVPANGNPTDGTSTDSDGTLPTNPGSSTVKTPSTDPETPPGPTVAGALDLRARDVPGREGLAHGG